MLHKLVYKPTIVIHLNIMTIKIGLITSCISSRINALLSFTLAKYAFLMLSFSPPFGSGEILWEIPPPFGNIWEIPPTWKIWEIPPLGNSDNM